MLDAAAIARLIPHQGRMCLLHRALAWDARSLRCEATAHRDPDNPLRRDGRLGSVCTVEMALQAMALHGALLDGAGQAPGFVTSLREVELHRAYADDLPSPLTIEVTLQARSAGGFGYAFAVTCSGEAVTRGAAMLVVPAPAEPGA